MEESIAGLRNQAAELAQSHVRDERELNALDQRLRELEGRALTLAAEIGTSLRQLEEVQSLRERLGRFGGELDESRELTETSIRQLRQELDVQRESGNDALRRLQASEKSLNDLRERLAVFDEAIRRVNTESGEFTHRLSQIDNSQVALGARISANADGLRRASGESSALEGRIEALERQLQGVIERLDLSYQSLRRVQETAEQWDDLKNNVDALRARIEESLQALDASKAILRGDGPPAAPSAGEFSPAARVTVPERPPPAPRRPAPTGAPAPESPPPAALPPPEPVAAEGRLLVRSMPPGAEVIVNGESRGTTPLALAELPYGPYEVEVSLAGYPSRSEGFVLDAGDPIGSLNADLAAAAAAAPAPGGVTAGSPSAGQVGIGSILAETRPPGAAVWLDQRLVGETPVSIPDVPAGAHHIEFRLDGYRIWTTTVEVAPATQARVAASLADAAR